ncbi:MAG: RagB/SusD protein [Gemmatimonadetes bacterium]|nr:RagB/SusD protein [Gemmatimonadota bacterium]
MRTRHGVIGALLLGVVAAGCTDLNLTDPNQRTADTFWQTEADATQGVNATYRALEENGTYGRWMQFATDIRSDVGRSRSPWGDLANFTKSVLSSYDFEVNRELWQHHYQAIFRANQVIANVPAIAMDAGRRDRIVGEAKFIRALMYFDLVNLYGSVPMTLAPAAPTERPAQASAAEAWAQVEKDLTEAAAVLPAGYSGADVGRATKGAAMGLLGKAYLQQGKWAQASAAFAAVRTSGQYQLLGNYGDNFVAANDNNLESVFEVQFGGPEVLAAGARGQNLLKMMGPCGVGFCDGEPTQWLFQQMQAEQTTTGGADPRLDATLFYNKPGGMDVYTQPFAQRYGDRLGDVFWKKMGEYYKDNQDWDNPINVKVMRLGGIMLLEAEALVEQNQLGPAKTLVDAVRARAHLAPLATLTQPQMRDAVEHEEIVELAFEQERWLWLERHGWLTDPAKIAVLKAHDPDFELFDAHRALLPIPSTETNLNPNVHQNPGW